MPKVSAFHSVNETHKPAQNRVYHDNSNCTPARAIPQNERRNGTGGYRLCHDCAESDRQGR